MSLNLNRMRQSIDINCDLGEGMGSDEALLDLVSSANIACGGHAGNEQTMTDCIRRAVSLGVAIGAHPGYCDRANFGRQPMDLPDATIAALLHEQITRLISIASREHAQVSHIRAHGALGNLTDANKDAAQLLTATVATQFPNMALMTLGGSAAEQCAKARGLTVVRQFFADRAYDDDGQLVARKIPGSVIHDSSEIVTRLLRALDSGTLFSMNGQPLAVSFDSICVHGDTPGALALAETIRKQLENNGIIIRPYLADVLFEKTTL